jgi:diguanylate cyclase (GGDEF)-like protein
MSLPTSLTPTQHAGGPINDLVRKRLAQSQLPTNPVVAACAVRLARDPAASEEDYLSVILSDPALSARALQLAQLKSTCNEPVTTVRAAARIIGRKHLRTVALGFHLPDSVDRIGDTPFDLVGFWHESLMRASLAQSTAEVTIPSRAEEAYLVGLLQDCGALLLAQVLGRPYIDQYRSHDLSPSESWSLERTRLGYTHVDALNLVARNWGLPGTIAEPLARHHQVPQPTDAQSDTATLATIGAFVGGITLSQDAPRSYVECNEFSQGMSLLGLTDTTWEQVQRRAIEDYLQRALLFQGILPEDTDSVALLNAANSCLFEAAVAGNTCFVDSHAGREEVARQEGGHGAPRRVSQKTPGVDALADAPDCRATLDVIRRAIADKRGVRVQLGVLLAEIDDFEQISGRCGDHVGDEILRSVAVALRRQVPAGTVVGRHDAETFLVALFDVSADEVRDAAEHIQHAVRALAVSVQERAIPVTVSLGGSWISDVQSGSPEELVTRAAKLLWAAKTRGKGCCEFEAPSVIADGGPAGSNADSCQEDGGLQRRSVADGRADTPARLRQLAEELNRGPKQTDVDNRKEPRRPLVGMCTLRHIKSGGSEPAVYPACVRNISGGGAAVLAAQPVARGARVELEMQSGGSHLFVPALVAFCRLVREDVYEMGIQFRPGRLLRREQK